MQRRRAELIDRWLSILGGLAVVVAVFGVVVFLDLRHQQDIGRDYLSHGVTSVATDVTLRIKSGRGGTYVDEVKVTFKLAGGEQQQTTLTNNLGDNERAQPGLRRPGPGTRYAPPLRILYQPTDPAQAIAEVDARYFTAGTTASKVAVGMIAGGITVAAAVALRHGLPGRRRLRQASKVPRDGEQ